MVEQSCSNKLLPPVTGPSGAIDVVARRGRHKIVTAIIQDRIILLSKKGLSIRSISRITKISRSSVYRTVAKIKLVS
jgi:DNA-binding CsgD family transcriptional regulator